MSASPPLGRAASERPGFLRQHAVKLLASAIITACLVYALQSGGLKIFPVGVSFARVRWWTVPVYLSTLIAMSYFRAARWRFLLRGRVDIPTRRLVAVSWIGFAAILILPFRIGEFVRPYMIRSAGRMEDGRRVGHVSMSMATGTILAERIIDFLYLSSVLAVALVWVPTLDPLPKTVVDLKVTVEQVRIYGFTMLGVSTVAFIVIAVFYFARAWAHRATLTVFGLVSRPVGAKLAGIAESLADGLHLLGRGRDAWPFFIETTFYWGINVLGMWLLAWGCGVAHADGSAITFGETCALMGMLGVTILIPGPPGLLGVFQAGIYAGMTMYFPKDIVKGNGAAYVFLLYAIQVGWTLMGAAIFLLADRSARSALGEAEAAAERGDQERPTGQ